MDNNAKMRTRLKEIMIRRGVNARKLAIDANLGASFVYDLLSGKSANPTFTRIKSIADILNIDPNYLFANDKYSNSNNSIAIKFLYLETKKGFSKICFEENEIIFDKKLFAINIDDYCESLALFRYENDIAVVSLGHESDLKNNNCYLYYNGQSLSLQRDLSNLPFTDIYQPNEKLGDESKLIGKVLFKIDNG